MKTSCHLRPWLCDTISSPIHGNEDIILTRFPSQIALEVVVLTMSSVAGYINFGKEKTKFHFNILILMSLTV